MKTLQEIYSLTSMYNLLKIELSVLSRLTFHWQVCKERINFTATRHPYKHPWFYSCITYNFNEMMENYRTAMFGERKVKLHVVQKFVPVAFPFINGHLCTNYKIKFKEARRVISSKQWKTWRQQFQIRIPIDSNFIFPNMFTLVEHGPLKSVKRTLGDMYM